MKNEIIDILKLAFKNFLFVFTLISVFVTVVASIKATFLINLLIYSFKIWVLVEIIYFVTMRIIRSIIKLINRKDV